MNWTNKKNINHRKSESIQRKKMMKFVFSKKATKIEKIFTVDLTLTT